MSRRLSKIVIYGSLLLAGHVHAAGKLIPLDDFVRHDQFSTPRLSPDGKHIAVAVHMPQADRFVPTVTIYSLPDLTITGVVRLPSFEVPLNFVWLTNNRLAMNKGLELGEREKPVSTGEVLAFDLDGGKQEYLYGRKMFQSSSRGDRYGDDYGYAYINNIPRPRNNHLTLGTQQWDSQHSMLYDINSLNATRKLLADIAMPSLTFVQQSNGVPRFAYGTNEQQKRVLYRRGDDGEWILQTDPAYGRTFYPFSFTPDDSAYFAYYSAAGGPQSLIRYEIASGERATLAANPGSNINTLEYDVDGVPFAAGTQTGIPNVTYFDLKKPEAQLHKQLSAQFPGDIVHFINYTDDGSKLLFSVVSDRDPGSYFLFDRATNKADLLFSSMPQIDPEAMAPRRPVHFTSRDGIDLYGYLTMPAHAAQQKLPMVLLPHGGPHGIFDSWFYDNDAQFLASRGYAVLQINFRGSGGRGALFRQSGFRHWGDKIQDDLIDGVRWAIAQGEVDGGRVCAYGASFGAYSALMLAARAPAGMFQCAVGYAGVYDLALFYDEDNARRSEKIKNTYIHYIGQDKDELARFSPARLAEQITIPVLLVHGGKDKVAQPAHAHAMRSALTKAGRPPEWLLAENEGHGFYDTQNVTRFLQTLEAFLATHIGNK